MSTLRLTTLYRYGLEALAKRLRQYRKAQSGDIHDREFVHELRVASRRARAAFALFEAFLPPDHAAIWRKALRRVTKQLGAARDLDVQLVFLETRQQLPPDETYPLLFSLSFRLRHQRAQLDRTINETLEECDPWLSDLERFLRHEIEELPAVNEEPDVEMLEAVTASMREAWREVRRCESQAKRRDRAEDWHALRIAIKKYRYILELFKKVFAPDSDEPLAMLKKAQDELGVHQDASTWIQLLEKEQPRKVLVGEGLTRLLKEQKSEQAESLQNFQLLWAEARSSGVWKTWRNALRLRRENAARPLLPAMKTELSGPTPMTPASSSI